MSMLISIYILTGFVTCGIHQWNGFDRLRQSWLWHWCMPSLHLEWYYMYATNDSGIHFHFCSSVEAGSPLKCWALLNFLWDLLNFMKLYDVCGWLLNWNEEVYNMGNKVQLILGYHLLVQELSRETYEHPVTVNIELLLRRTKFDKSRNFFAVSESRISGLQVRYLHFGVNRTIYNAKYLYLYN